MLDKLKSILLRPVWPPPGEAAPALPQEVRHPQAQVTLKQSEDLLLVCADFSPEPLAQLRGALAGSGTGARADVGGRQAMVVTFPVESRGQRHKVTLTAVLSEGTGFERIRATRRLQPDGTQALEVAYARGDQQCRFLLELPSEVEPVGFQEFSRARAVFDEVPPVAQMVAFLKATLHHRRTTLRSLSTMARRCKDERVQQVVEALEARLSSGHDFSNPGIMLCRAFLESKGKTIQANTVAALCLLADIWMGNLREQELTALLERDVALPTSSEAARAVVGFFGVKQSTSDWKKLVGKKTPDPKVAQEAETFLKKAVGQRNALTILEDLADDSGSERSRSRVQRLLAKVPFNQVLVNDEHEALRSFLALSGRPIQRDTVAALGIYVDFEAGILSEEDIDALTPQRGFWDTSLYGMTAISGAFDAELRAFRVPEESGWSQLAALTKASEGGVVARFIELGAPGYLTCHLATPEAVEAARQQGLRFTGQLLARLPILDHLSEDDLRVFMGSGQPVFALFGSEEHHYQWRRVEERLREGPAGELLRSEFSFLEGYEVYHFHDRVVAQRAPAQSEGRLAVYRDSRGKAHFEPGPGLEFTGEEVVFPDLSGCPEVLVEPSHDYLLGRPDERTPHRTRLQRIYQGLVDYLNRARVYHDLRLHPRQWERLKEGLQSPWLRAIVLGTVDAGTRNDLVASVEGSLALGVSESMLQSLELSELVEFPVLRSLFEMCEDQELEVPCGRKYYQRGKFVELLLDRLYAATDSEDPVVRMVACRMLGTDLLAGSEQRQLAVSYVLARMFDHDKTSVARAAARSLCALALQEAIPLPSLVRLQGGGVAKGNERDELLAEMSSPHPELAELLAGLNQAFRVDGSLDEERWLFVASAVQVAEVAANARECWDRLRQVWEGDAERAVRAYLTRLPDLRAQTGQSERKGAFPFFGGISGPVRLFRLDPGVACHVVSQELPTAWYLHLAEGFAPDLRVLRWQPPQPPASEGLFDEAVHAHELSVFEEGAFCPLLEGQGVRARPVPAAGPVSEAPAGATLDELASAVARVFNLAPEQKRAVWTMLAGLTSEGAFSNAGALLR